MTPKTPASHHEHDEDAAHLAALGYSYDITFRREMSFWSNVALGFTYLSPIVGAYSMFAISLGEAGPPMAWVLLIALIGQFLVALNFGEVVSNYPVAGGVYPWSRRLWGRKWAWMNGWVYVIALIGTIAAVAYSGAPFMAAVFGAVPDAMRNWQVALVALGMILVAMVLNFSGTKVLSLAARFGLGAEIVGALLIGGYILLFHREHDFSVFFDNQGIGDDAPGGYLGAFAAAALLGMFSYYGFEANGDVAEEVKDASRQVPRAMRMTLYIGGFASHLLVFSLVLAVPDFRAVASGESGDPIDELTHRVFGPLFPLVMLIVGIAFTMCVTSLQAAASRLLYSMSRDNFLPGSRFLQRFDERRHVPRNALFLAALFPSLIITLSLLLEHARLAMVGFGTVGIYLGFHMVILAALRARFLGWKPAGKFRLGRWALPTNIIALTWGVLAITNILWPRPTGGGWAEDWLLIMTTVAIIGIGWIYMLVSKAYRHGDAPAGDAAAKRVPPTTGKQ